MKGIILAGGRGTRLYPATQALSKQSLPVYNKPMIYYPMSTLMLTGIKEVMIISSVEHIDCYKEMFGDGSKLGMSICYAVQDEPKGIAEAFILGEDFIGQDDVFLILGDNILFGWQMSEILKDSRDSVSNYKKPKIFGYHINNPTEFGVAEIDSDLNVVSLEEKPKNPKSNWAVIGLYMYDNSVVRIAKSLTPSDRGELEITDINKEYLENNNLGIQLLGRGCTWFDAGNCDDFYDAASFVRTLEKRQGFKIACLEEIAFNNGWIDKKQLSQLAYSMRSSAYGKYLEELFSDLQ